MLIVSTIFMFVKHSIIIMRHPQMEYFILVLELRAQRTMPVTQLG